MKLCFFDDFRLGVVKGDTVVDVMDVVADIPRLQPQDLINGLIQRFDAYKGRLEAAVAQGQGRPLSGVRFRSPLPRPQTIVCMAVNYMEDGTLPEPPKINAFMKVPQAAIGDGDTMVLPDVPATVFEGEAELGVVFSRPASHVSQADAMDYVFGYLNFIDGSARGLPPEGNTFYQMKSRDTFAPMGPFLVTKDEVPNPQDVHVQLWNNGEIKQDFRTSDMAHKIVRCIEWVTSSHSMGPGDVLATGTNHWGLHPFQDGARIEMEIEGLGRLHITVRDDLKRGWDRDTHRDRHAKGLRGGSPQATGKYAKTE